MAYRRSAWRLLKEQRVAALLRRGDHASPALRCTGADLAELERSIRGEIVLPGDPAYDGARQLANPAFRRLPCLIVYCETPGDVRCCLELARRFDLWIATRSGGHSTAGYSVNDGGLVIDMSRMQHVRIERDRGPGSDRAARAHVAAGSQWGYVYAVLDSYGLHIPGGGCEGVCVGGFLQGGGYSLTSRLFGMNCDNVLSLTVMLADGRIVTADEQQNRPLFWAMRGGTGNNFGILLEATYRTVPDGPWWGFKIQWEIDDAPAAIVEMQDNYMRTGPADLGYRTNATTQDGRQVLLMGGIYRGSEDQGRAAIASLLGTPGARLQYAMTSSYLEINRALEEFPAPTVQPPPGAAEDKQSGYLRAPLGRAEWEEIVAFFKHTPNPWSAFELEPYGGAINAVPPGSNAFVHRDACCDFFLDVFWTTDAEKAHAVRYLDDFMALMQPHFDRPDGRPQAFQNYPRGTQQNYLDLYFDGFVGDLVTAKRLYDPGNLFRFQQSIPLAAPAGTRVHPASPGFTGAEPIVYDD